MIFKKSIDIVILECLKIQGSKGISMKTQLNSTPQSQEHPRTIDV